jgi:hypothetical protein
MDAEEGCRPSRAHCLLARSAVARTGDKRRGARYRHEAQGAVATCRRGATAARRKEQAGARRRRRLQSLAWDSACNTRTTAPVAVPEGGTAIASKRQPMASEASLAPRPD